jgi:hypothetical protein
MARIKDVNNSKKRIKPVSLSKRAFTIFKEIKHNDPNFNFSNFVSRQIEKLYCSVDLKILEIDQEIDYLREQQEKQWQDMELKITNLINDRIKLTQKTDENTEKLELFA